MNGEAWPHSVVSRECGETLSCMQMPQGEYAGMHRRIAVVSLHATVKVVRKSGGSATHTTSGYAPVLGKLG